MSIWGKLAGAAAGLAVGGPIGAIVGAVAGHYALDRERGEVAAPDREIAFTIGVIALGAKMAKADGVVTRDEVSAFRQVFQVPPAELENVARIFNLAKRDVAGYEAYAGQLAQLFGPRAEILEDVLDGLFHIAKADGAVHSAETSFLKLVAHRFGFDDAAFAQISARHVAPDARDPYVVLGAGREVGDDEIKRIYRKLVRENHPDRLIARGVPEEFVVIANERLARINEAYDRIQKARGFT
jgi:DnaJ like chaperone protein